MPSIIIDKKPSGEYIRIVESYHDDTGKPHSRHFLVCEGLRVFPLNPSKGWGSDCTNWTEGI